MPLAKATGGVAVFPQHFCDSNFTRIKPPTVPGKSHHQVSVPAVHADAVGVGSSEQGCPRWGACGIGDVELSELDSLRRHPIQVRCLIDRVAKGTDIAIAHIIDEHEHDVRLGRRPRERTRQQQTGY